MDTLRPAAGEQFDLAFLDADKPGYLAYYQEIVPRLRVGGLLLADNTLQGGDVLDAGAATSPRSPSAPSTTPWPPIPGSGRCSFPSATE